MKIDILAIGVHPDDVELCCSGTLLRHMDMGKTVGILDLTQGELGTRGNAQIRQEEANEAARILDVSVRKTLDMQDGFFDHNRDNLLRIVEVIREYRPEIVLANAIEDRHPDHGRASKLISDACFLSGLQKIETNKVAWRPKAVYHYIQDKNLTPDFVIDITDYMSTKMEAILAYKSQFYDPNSKEKETPISSSAFLEFIKAKNRVYGRHIGAEFGEGFNIERTLGVKNLFDLQ